MILKIGYLLPTREMIIAGRPEVAPLLALAARAETLGFDSLWLGDSLLAKPRHEPLTLLAAVAGRCPKLELGTAVLLPALRNPVLLAQQIATLDQAAEGRLVLGVGIARDVPAIRAEFAAAGVPFDKRVGRMLEGLRLARALWSGEPVTWSGRWPLDDAQLAPLPHRPGGPPIWYGGSAPAGLERTGRNFDGWFPNGPNPEMFAERLQTVRQHARDAGRDPDGITGAIYLTLTIDDDADRGMARIDDFLFRYYNQPAAEMKRSQDCYAGPVSGAAAWLKAYADAGAEHIVLRFAGDHDRHLESLSGIRAELGW